ncbi:uncharacterized protein LOC133819037 isoform X1 [Humulus lupulus]|uniref:uncharacterized protein LOC133819037 isoform X1 n=1 Tax=Humulus lupulus TaxID=3486 RepID=UPI002B40AE5D|nr:uncharacterized protein LOC133819037 isoform X1 [Humulus lupulus]XP_062108163.1 uncharacterized protein LOC133819037 isoform X1 [Humulus lupulus]
MLGGVKFIPRDQIAKDDSSDNLKKERKKSSRKEKHRRKKRSSRYSSSDEDLEKVKKTSRKKKWYSSDEHSPSLYSSESSSEDDKRGRSRRKGKKSYDDSSGDEATEKSKRKSRSSKEGSKEHRRKADKKGSQRDIAEQDMSDDSRGADIARKEIGLEWMLRPEEKTDRRHEEAIENEPVVDDKTEEKRTVNPRELNPYFKDDGSGYPEENVEPKAGDPKLLSSSLVGDGGASWRLKALKRAREQAARDGRKVDEVVEERWGSLGQLAVSVASNRAAPSRAHLHAIKSRQRGHADESNTESENRHEKDIELKTNRDYLKDVSVKRPRMREPKVQDSLSWRKQRNQNVSTQDAGLISDTISSMNKFADDGSFLRGVLQKQSNNSSSSTVRENVNLKTETSSIVKESLSANQLAAKALQLRMKGKHEEAEKLMKEVGSIKAKQDGDDTLNKPRREESSSCSVIQDMSLRRKKNEDDADMHLAQKIMQNKQYSMSGRADDEYDFDDSPRKKSQKKWGGDDQATQKNMMVNRFSLNQQERCIFCLENPRRPKHLVVAIGNYTYLMLPQQEPLVPGHCCILTMQHVPSTVSVDDDVWEEIRNFKKCLIMMFAEKEKDVVFLETVVDLPQQRRHCLVECIPVPRETDEDPVNYFKKEIRDAEDDWAVAKNVDTESKGLRGKIPKNIPYFHVEFGLKRGFLHQIDDEEQFRSGFGLNVMRGILELPEEDMYRRRRQRSESVSEQMQAVQKFSRDWEPFDWTKQLHQ